MPVKHKFISVHKKYIYFCTEKCYCNHLKCYTCIVVSWVASSGRVSGTLRSWFLDRLYNSMFGIIFLLKCSFVDCCVVPGHICISSALYHMYWSLTLSWCSFLVMNLTAYFFLCISPFPRISIFIANFHVIFWHFKYIIISFMDNFSNLGLLSDFTNSVSLSPHSAGRWM